MRQFEQGQWGHFVVKVRREGPEAVWEIEDLGSGERACLPSPAEMVEFIQTHLQPRPDQQPRERKNRTL